MRLIEVGRDRAAEAADTLARAMLDEPSGRWLLPDPDEFLAVHRELYAALIGLALDEGHVDAWGDPMMGVAVWLERPSIHAAPPTSARAGAVLQLSVVFPGHAADRAQRYATVIRQLRERARPDKHAYLDSMAVVPDYRRHGIASALLAAGHGWADAARLPCALDTESPGNVSFYQRRGYQVIAESPVPGSDLRAMAMRRPVPE